MTGTYTNISEQQEGTHPGHFPTQKPRGLRGSRMGQLSRMRRGWPGRSCPEREGSSSGRPQGLVAIGALGAHGAGTEHEDRSEGSCAVSLFTSERAGWGALGSRLC